MEKDLAYQCYFLHYVIKNNKTFIEIKNKGLAVIGELFSNNKIEEPINFSNSIYLDDKEMTIHNYSLWKLLIELKDFNFNDNFICYEKGKKYFYDNYVNNNLEIEDKINNMSFQFNNIWKYKIITIHSIVGDKPNFESSIYNMGILNAYIHYEKENFYLFEKYLQEENQENIEIAEPQPYEVEIPNKTALTSCSVQVSMLNQMGVLDLPIFQNKNQAQKERILSKLLNRGIRDIRGNLNSLNPNSNEDLTKYTAGSEGTQAKARDILNQL